MHILFALKQLWLSSIFVNTFSFVWILCDIIDAVFPNTAHHWYERDKYKVRFNNKHAYNRRSSCCGLIAPWIRVRAVAEQVPETWGAEKPPAQARRDERDDRTAGGGDSGWDCPLLLLKCILFGNINTFCMFNYFSTRIFTFFTLFFVKIVEWLWTFVKIVLVKAS